MKENDWSGSFGGGRALVAFVFILHAEWTHSEEQIEFQIIHSAVATVSLINNDNSFVKNKRLEKNVLAAHVCL